LEADAAGKVREIAISREVGDSVLYRSLFRLLGRRRFPKNRFLANFSIAASFLPTTHELAFAASGHLLAFIRSPHRFLW
jgi:hypothetical protein